MGTRRAAAGSPWGAVGVALETPIGWVAAASVGGRLVATTLPRARREEALDALGVEAAAGSPGALLAALADDLRRYLAGERVDFRRFPVDLSGQPPFLRRVLLAARGIPYGRTCSYGWLAGAAGSPAAARAAGQAMARNPLPLVIPCHRVVAADGRLGGFGGGLDLKRRLLALEGVDVTGERVAAGVLRAPPSV